MNDTNKYLISADEISRMPGKEKIHFLNPNAIRLNKSLGDAVGLQNLGVHIIEVAPGRDSTEYHKHYYEEECVYILSGQASLTIEGQEYRVAAGDFMGFPCDGAAHGLSNDGSETLVCMVIGQRLAQDISDYPHKHKRLYRNSGTWDLLNINDVTLIEK